MGMRVGMIGLGKIGMPIAACMARAGMHQVIGHDSDPKRMSGNPDDYQGWERGPDGKSGDFRDYLRGVDTLRFGSIAEVVTQSDVVFVAVPTPHESDFDGTKVVEGAMADFSYDHLLQVIDAINDVPGDGRWPVIAIISTVLPGTCERLLRPRLSKRFPLVYNPSMVAMGSTLRDYLDPEFVLIGIDDDNPAAMSAIRAVYSDMAIGPIRKVSVAEAEVTKCLYNLFITSKITFSNIVGEICDKVGANSDEVMQTLWMAKRRLISTFYMSAGMGDAGACHPRDLVAMSYFSKKNDLSYDYFAALIAARDAHARRLAELIDSTAKVTDLPVVIYGCAYKPNVPITAGSHALLVSHFLRKNHSLEHDIVDPIVDGKKSYWQSPCLFFIGINHDCVVSDFHPPSGSVVIDPFRIYEPSVDSGIRVMPLGAGFDYFPETDPAQG